MADGPTIFEAEMLPPRCRVLPRASGTLSPQARLKAVRKDRIHISEKGGNKVRFLRFGTSGDPGRIGIRLFELRQDEVGAFRRPAAEGQNRATPVRKPR